jgi:hypothetical protein
MLLKSASFVIYVHTFVLFTGHLKYLISGGSWEQVCAKGTALV